MSVTHRQENYCKLQYIVKFDTSSAVSDYPFYSITHSSVEFSQILNVVLALQCVSLKPARFNW